MTHKSYRLDPNVRTITDLVTDEQVQSSFRGANFGHDDFRGLLAQGCIKALAGWHQGRTITTKGRHYIWAAFKGRPGV